MSKMVPNRFVHLRSVIVGDKHPAAVDHFHHRRQKVRSSMKLTHQPNCLPLAVFPPNIINISLFDNHQSSAKCSSLTGVCGKQKFCSDIKNPNRIQTIGDRAFAAAGPRTWNSLPPAVRSSATYNIFKKDLKSHFFGLSFSLWQLCTLTMYSALVVVHTAYCAYTNRLTYITLHYIKKFNVCADGFPTETACNLQFKLKVIKITLLADVQIKKRSKTRQKPSLAYRF